MGLDDEVLEEGEVMVWDTYKHLETAMCVLKGACTHATQTEVPATDGRWADDEYISRDGYGVWHDFRKTPRV